jgi:hypothetical protein
MALAARFCVVRCKLCGVVCQSYEYALGNVFRRVRIAHHSQGCRIDEVNVTAYQLGKRRLGVTSRVFPQKLLVGLSVQSQIITARFKNRTAIQFEQPQNGEPNFQMASPPDCVTDAVLKSAKTLRWEKVKKVK